MKDLYLVVAIVFGVAGIAAGILVAGCGHGAEACGAIDLAKTACDVTPIRFMGDDGQEHTEQVPTEQVKALAQRTRMARMGLSPDGGTDGHAAD